jgi:hypothetical protein
VGIAMKLRVAKIVFHDLELDAWDTPKLRGAVAKMFPHQTLLHHHIEKGHLLYQYPRIQYKVIEGMPIIVAIREGIETMEEIYSEVGRLNIGKGELHSELKIEVKDQPFGSADDLLEYRFITPWIALNQNNYEKFVSGSRETKDKLLKSILVGNILSLSKSLGYSVKSRILINLRLHGTRSTLKRNTMLAFYGRFLVNFEIPDYLGIGKSVSRGFGTVKRSKS